MRDPVRATRRRCLIVLVVGSASAQPTIDAVAQKSVKSRPMEVDDLFRSERVLDLAPSPDGSLVAVVVRRAATSQERYQQGVATEGRADIWLVRSDGAGKRNVTSGVSDASGYWMPTWSPDGAHLAMLSTKGGDVRAYVWSRRTDSLTRLTDGSVDLSASADPHGGNRNRHPYAWVSPTELVVMLTPPGHRSWLAEMRVAGMRTAVEEWPKAERGGEPTVSVLDAGPGIKQVMRIGTLTLVNVASGQSRMLADIPMEENSSGSRSFVLSPSRRHAIVLTSERRPIDASQRRLTRSQARNRIGIVSLAAAHPGIRWIDTVSAVIGQTSEHVIRWSPHDTVVAILAKETANLDGPSRLYAVSAIDGTVRRLLSDDWDTGRLEIAQSETPLEQAGLVWAQDGRPVVYARPSIDSTRAPRRARFDWWLIDGGRSPRNLTASMADVPQVLSRTWDPRVLVGLSAGDLWALDVDGSAPRTLTPARSRARAIVWPAPPDLPGVTLDRVIVDVGTSLRQDLRAIMIGAHGGERHVSAPARAGALIDYLPGASLAVFTDSVNRVTVVRGRRPIEVLALNTGLPRIKLPGQRLITYRGTDGDTLKAVLVLPNGYVPGKRYPMIARAYAGWISRDTLSLRDALNDDLKLFAAHGYAVLVPSMPLKPTTVASDPYNDIPKGVIPAVDRAIEIGVADPARLGVTGVNYGAYSTYALITATTRFRAAVAEMGPANLIASYGAFRATERYSDEPHLTLANATIAEDGQFRMGTSPWTDLWRYIKNSPFFYLDRVETPLLIIQSDQDIVGMDEVEGVFTAMQRFGKRAALARYWGEWQGLDSPANIRDCWQRKLAWFDQFLGVGTSPAGPRS